MHRALRRAIALRRIAFPVVKPARNGENGAMAMNGIVDRIIDRIIGWIARADCDSCGGSGEIRKINPAKKGNYSEPCPYCLGKGKQISEFWRETIRLLRLWSVPVLLVIGVIVILVLIYNYIR